MNLHKTILIAMKCFWLFLVKILKNNIGEVHIGILGDILTNNLREKVIGKTVYHVKSVFEGEKDIDKTLERLAVKNAIHSGVDNKQTN